METNYVVSKELKRTILGYFAEGELKGNIARILDLDLGVIEYVVTDWYNSMKPIEYRLIHSFLEDGITLKDFVAQNKEIISMYRAQRILDVYRVYPNDVKKVKTTRCYLGKDKEEYDIILEYRKGNIFTNGSKPEPVMKYLESLPDKAGKAIEWYLDDVSIDYIHNHLKITKHKIYVFLERYQVIKKRNEVYASIRGNRNYVD